MCGINPPSSCLVVQLDIEIRANNQIRQRCNMDVFGLGVRYGSRRLGRNQ